MVANNFLIKSFRFYLISIMNLEIIEFMFISVEQIFIKIVSESSLHVFVFVDIHLKHMNGGIQNQKT